MSRKQQPYRILGIDPGTNILGYAVIEIINQQMTLLEMGVVKLDQFTEQQHKLKRIFERIQTIIEVYHPKEMAVEAPFFGKNAQSMLKLGRAQGVSIAAAITKNVPITEYSPKKIKKSVTGNGNAAKEQVAAMLSNVFKMDMSEHYLDATDALATAVCHFYQAGRMTGTEKKYSGWGSFIKNNPGRIK